MDIIDVATGEIGYKEGANNSTKYGQWFGMNNAPWCQMFVSWCAYKAGESAAVVKTASTDTGMEWFKNKGQFKYKGKYTPKRGDIVYFKTNRSHVGLVEKVVGNTLHTIEGNSGNEVKRKTYSLSEATLTGYGVPNYKNSTSGSSDTKDKSSKNELKELRRILDKQNEKNPIKSYEAEEIDTGKVPNTEIIMMVQNGKKLFQVPCRDEVQICWERKGSPGRMTFTAMYDSKFKIVEGNAVTFSVGGKKMFFGFVFTRKVSKDGWVEYTVYDQLRYLKNKDTRVIKKKRADQIIKKIADDFSLQCGKLTNTGYTMSMVKDNSTLFDIIQDALDDTLMQKGKMYVLYDKVGKLTLADISTMKVNACLVDAETGQDFSYQTSIDNEVYNQIKLIYENKEKGSYDVYMAKDTKNQNKWGVLQFLEKIDSPDVGKLKSKCLLKMYNQTAKTLTIEGVLGNSKVRAGCMVPVNLDIYNLKVANYMIVEKVTHRISNGQWLMDLEVSGGGIS